MFPCKTCDKQFARKDSLHRHEEGYCKPLRQLCEICGVVFASRGYFRVHQSRKHNLRRGVVENKERAVLTEKHRLQKRKLEDEDDYTSKKIRVNESARCETCDVDVPRKYMTQHSRSIKHKTKIITGDGVTLISQSFKNRIAAYRVSTDDNKVYMNVKEFMELLKPKIANLILTMLNRHTVMKVNMELFGLFALESKYLRDVKSFNTKYKICDLSTGLVDMYRSFVDEIDNKTSEFQERDSGWTLEKLLFIELNVSKYNPLKASSYISLPRSIQQKHAVVNIQNFDNKCFMWSILAALHPAECHMERVGNYEKYEEQLNFDGIEFPVKLKDINKFEELNDISVNVYALESIYNEGAMKVEVVGPLHFTKLRRNTHVNLLLIDDDEGRSHYCFIKNLSRLVSRQLSAKKDKKFLCDGCLINFKDLKHLVVHQENDCKNVRVILPTTEPRVDKFGNTLPQNILKFESFEKQLKHPFSVYADFESMLSPIQYCQKDGDGPFTEKTHVHAPYSFAYYIKCSYTDSLSKLEVYQGQDCAEVFCQRLEDDIKRIYNTHLKHIAPMNKLTDQEILTQSLATNCYICEKLFLENDEKVRDHCHLTGDYRGPAHATCNLNYKIQKFIPVFFHNLSNYDAHLFVKALGTDENKIEVIAENKEKYISFSKHVHVDKIISKDGKEDNVFMKIRFLDSYRFMPMSLDKLARNLSDKQCVEIKKYFAEEEKFNLIRQKGVFPYSYVNSIEKLDDVELPSREQFYNDLTNMETSDADYERAKKVWDLFRCETLGEYSDIYLKSDVLLLADIFENFRDICLSTYKLDPCNFFTAPGLSWTAMLKHTAIELELLTDIDMLHFFKRGIRGGLCHCSKRIVQANNPYMSSFNPDKQTSYLTYLDATNLYGASLSMYLPTGDFDWLSDDVIQNFDVMQISNTSDRGYVLEVDLDYPIEIHDLHNDLPFCPENMIPPNSKLPKLMATLSGKQRYIIHYRNLNQCLTAGLKLKKIHRILSFNQSPWLKTYVDLNTEKRNQAANEFEKTFYKLMNNSVFGKTMENVDRRSDIRLITHWESKGRRLGAEALISKPQFKGRSIFSENLVAIQMEKLQVRYDKPIYIGFCVLDLAKYIMYDFHYNYIKATYGEKALLAYTDTDSLILEVFTNDFYEDIKKNLAYFDTSNYSPNNGFGIPKSESVIGKMKDEYGGRILWEFVGTGAKAYAVDVEGEYTKKAKGIQSSVIKNDLRIGDYRDVVLHNKTIYRKVKQFSSYNHQLYTEIKNKVALSPEDHKRFIVPDGSGNTLAWGHYRLTENRYINYSIL